MRYVFLSFIACAIISVQLKANIKLPGLITDNMVLQRDMPLKIWGWADAGETVVVSFKGNNYQATTGPDGKWLIAMPPQKTGGPLDMLLKGKNEIHLKNIFIGDVWLCGGQSNMEFKLGSLPLKYIEKWIHDSNPNIRITTVKNAQSFNPEQDVETTGWEVLSPVSLRNFSAVAYFFGADIYKSTKVPVGLIVSSWGGTGVESWTSAEGLKEFPHKLDMFELAKNDTLLDVKGQNWQTLQKQAIKQSLADTSFANTRFDTTGWKTMTLPSPWNTDDLSNFVGVSWFTRDIELPSHLVGKKLTMHAPAIDDMDYTFINGRKIGNSDCFYLARDYSIPQGLLKEGKNTFTIMMANFDGMAGMIGDTADFYLQSDTAHISLSGLWKYTRGKAYNLPPKPIDRNSVDVPTVLFNAMVYPLKDYSIKGAIWYQGESNASRPEEYRKLFPSLITDWRRVWGYEFPFIFVQLPNFASADPWAELREAQSLALHLPKTGMAVTIDIGDPYNIHPSNKLDVGKRLALVARKVAYGENITFTGPNYKSSVTEGDKIRIKFENTGSGLYAKGDVLNEFAIAGSDGKFVVAQAQIEGNTVIVSNKTIINPVFVRYAWASCPAKPNLYNQEGLPAAPFRTDK